MVSLKREMKIFFVRRYVLKFCNFGIFTAREVLKFLFRHIERTQGSQKSAKYSILDLLKNIPAKSVEFQIFIPMLPLIFGGKIRKMLADLLKMCKILVDFLSFFGKSV